MTVQGRDCLIVIKTQYREVGIPYAEETIREAVSLLTEEASIEGDGLCRAIRKSGQQVGLGVTGCVVTPLTIGTAPFLLYLAMGSAGLPLFVSETRNLYRYKLNLLPLEGSSHFDLVQDRAPFGKPNGDAENQGFSAHLSAGRKLYEGCAVTGFELRINRGEAVKLRLDISGERPAAVYPYQDIAPTETGERFMGDRVSYRINVTEYKNIYGLTVSVKKDGGTKTVVRIKRVLEPGTDVPDLIDELIITARLYRDKYEYRYYGTFRLTLTRLVLTADGTAVDTGGAVIGSLRYYCAGLVQAEVFTTTGENLE
jgi:hypothetical protein